MINAGFGRTGTMSIKLALEQLGLGPCHHMEEIRNDPAQLPYWEQVVNGARVEWDKVFDGYHSAVDWPSAYYWHELAVYYPDAKVILSVRPAEKWWDSFSSTIRGILAIREQIPDAYIRKMAAMADKIVTEQTFGGRIDDKAYVLEVYQHHIDTVKQGIPAERLLVYEVTQGWEPLCAFLGMPVPDVEFPRSNAKEEFWEVFGGGSGPGV